ncbi:MAG TPA: c-type cytochrome [Blastocatellia bacterium]
MYLKNRAYLKSRVARCIKTFLCVLVLSGTWAFGHNGAQDKASGNAEAKKLKNPEPDSAETLEAGRKVYQRNCAGCHGPGGKGDGSMALSGGTPSDLTDDVWDHGSSDGEIFMVIHDGVSADMQGYKDKLTDKQIWQVIRFIRSLRVAESKSPGA